MELKFKQYVHHHGSHIFLHIQKHRHTYALCWSASGHFLWTMGKHHGFVCCVHLPESIVSTISGSYPCRDNRQTLSSLENMHWTPYHSLLSQKHSQIWFNDGRIYSSACTLDSWWRGQLMWTQITSNFPTPELSQCTIAQDSRLHQKKISLLGFALMHLVDAMVAYQRSIPPFPRILSGALVISCRLAPRTMSEKSKAITLFLSQEMNAKHMLECQFTFRKASWRS